MHDLKRFSYVQRLNILGIETVNRRSVIFDLILCYKNFHGLVEISNCNFVLLSRTKGNEMKLYKDSAVSMRDINSSLIVLLIYRIVYQLQSSLATMCRLLGKLTFSSFLHYS